MRGVEWYPEESSACCSVTIASAVLLTACGEDNGGGDGGSQAIYNNVNEALSGRVSAEEALKNAQAQMQQALETF
jgi:hypothetical protein